MGVAESPCGPPRGLTILTQASATLDEPSASVVISPSGRCHGQCPTPGAGHKSGKFEAVAPITVGGGGDTSHSVQVHVYRQTQSFGSTDTEGEEVEDAGPLMSCLAVLLCVPRTGSVRVSKPAASQPSVYDVDTDFVSTWQAAQAKAAPPVLKRAISESPFAQASATLPTTVSPEPPEPPDDQLGAAPSFHASPAVQRSASVRSPTEITWQNSNNTSNNTSNGIGSDQGSRTTSGAAHKEPHSRISSQLVQCLSELNARSVASQSNSCSRPTSKRGIRWG